MIYFDILVAIASVILLLYFGTVIAVLAVMAIIRGVQCVGAFLKGRVA